MKKKLILAMVWVLVLGIAGTSFAASNPFVDVPANHWAYKAVADLQKRGLVDGYGDGTFKGDKVMSRYEMATVVAKAMANADKADAAAKAQLDKLQAEFAAELQNLGVKVDAVNAKVDNMLKFTGDARIRYFKNAGLDGRSDGSPDASRLQERVRFAVTQKVNDNWTAKIQFGAQNNSTRDGAGGWTRDDGTKSSAYGQFMFNTMEFAYKNNNWFGSIGRSSTICLGQGLILWADGIDMMMLGYQNSNLKVRTMYGDVSPAGPIWGRAGYDYRYPTQNVFMADASYQFPNVQVSAAYTKNVTTDYHFKQMAFGFNAKLGKDFLLTGEYVKNNHGDLPGNAQKSGYMIGLDYKGADMNKPNSYGVSLYYQKLGDWAVDGKLTGLTWQDSSVGTKGWSLSVDYVPAKNMQLTYLMGKFSPYDKSRADSKFDFNLSYTLMLQYKF